MAAPERPGFVVCVGASAGGVEALGALLASLPDDLDASVVVVLHLAPNGPGLLDRVLGRRSRWPVEAASEYAPLRRGTVLVAPVDHHVIVYCDHVRVTRGPRENGHRPSIDVLLRSAALNWGERAVGVVLTGALDDGAAGAAAIAGAGGIVVVQDPDEAIVPDMPRHACERVPDAVLGPVAKIGDIVRDLIQERSARAPHVDPDAMVIAPTEVAIATDGSTDDWPGGATAAGLSCPDCDGSLFEVPGDTDRVRCRVGHAWTYNALAAQHATELEAALWFAARIIKDDLTLQDRLADRARESGRSFALERIRRRQQEGHHFLALLERMVRSTTPDGVLDDSVDDARG